MTKSELVNELKRLGIDASLTLKKVELQRMLKLAKSANNELTPHRVYKPQYNESRFQMLGYSPAMISWILMGSILVVVVIITSILFNVNNTFRNNVAYLAGKIGIELDTTDLDEDDELPETQLAEGQTGPLGPQIFERNNKTYVVYDFPLIKVDILGDSGCKREACDTTPLVEQVKNSITPLVRFNPIDYTSRAGQELIEKYEITALPVFIFNEDLNKTDNFDKVQHFFSQVNDKYILQAEPYKVLSGPNLAGTHFKGATPDSAKISLVEFSSFSCPHCNSAKEIVNQLLEKYPDQITYYYKHFDRGGNDSLAVRASECAAEQDQFWQMHKKLFDEQDSWVGEEAGRVRTLLRGYAQQLRLDRTKFTECYDSEKYAEIVVNDTEEAKKLGVENLPTFILNQDIITGIYPIEEFSKWVDNELGNLEDLVE